MRSIFFKDLLIKFIKFGLTGGICFFVDISVAYLCHGVWKLDAFLSNYLGIACALAIKYVINCKWVFKHSKLLDWKTFISFVVTNILGIVITIFIFNGLYNYTNSGFMMSKISSIFLVAFLNFLTAYYYTFKTASRVVSTADTQAEAKTLTS